MRVQTRTRRLFLAIFGFITALFIRLLGATWRYQIIGPNPLENGSPRVIGATWHRGILISAHYCRDRKFLAMVSLSKDGDLVTSTIPHLGYSLPARGSSSRGGSNALRRSVEAARSGISVGLFPDGPRGPARELKSGVLRLAAMSDSALTPGGMAARPAISFNSWDRTILPLPFARVVIVYGEPIEIPPNARGEGLEETRLAIENVLNRLTDQADEALGIIPPNKE